MKKKVTTKKTRIEKKLPTYVSFLLDKSGSMKSIIDATLEGFNGFLDGLKKEKTVRLSFYKFDSRRLETVYENKKVEDVPDLTTDTFIPGQMTPLIDSAYKVIKKAEEFSKKTKGKHKVVICIQTDGFENDSREHTREQLKKLIEAKTKAGWAFNYMGAALDAYGQSQMYAQAAGMGIGTSNTTSYTARSLENTRSMFTSTADNIGKYTWSNEANTSYSPQQKAASGDVIDVKVKAKK